MGGACGPGVSCYGGDVIKGLACTRVSIVRLKDPFSLLFLGWPADLAPLTQPQIATLSIADYSTLDANVAVGLKGLVSLSSTIQLSAHATAALTGTWSPDEGVGLQVGCWMGEMGASVI